MKLPLTVVLTIAVITASAQSKKNIALFLLDKDWKSCMKAEHAAYLCQREKVDDTTYTWKYYNFLGPLVSIETSRDELGEQPNGYMAFYGADGKIDSSGHTINGRKNDWWYYYTDSFTVWLKEKYRNGKLLERMDTLAMRLERERKEAERDTTEVLVEASFKGGDKDWMKYIQKTINVPDRTRNANAQGKLMLRFIVGTDGTVGDIQIQQSLEYAIDEELIRVIAASPKWKPASINNNNVKAYRGQPITIRF